MRCLSLTLIAMFLGGCATATALYDEATGTTLEERCESRRAGLAMYDALGRDLSETEAKVYNYYQVFVEGSCPPIE